MGAFLDAAGGAVQAALTNLYLKMYLFPLSQKYLLNHLKSQNHLLLLQTLEIGNLNSGLISIKKWKLILKMLTLNLNTFMS